jgi:hypothetical protein
MPQFTLPFKYEEETRTSGLTGRAGLPLYLELLNKLNIFNIMRNIFDVDTHEATVWIRRLKKTLTREAGPYMDSGPARHLLLPKILLWSEVSPFREIPT